MNKWLQSIRGVFCKKADHQEALNAHLVDIETPRLRLREFTMDDVEGIHRMTSKPGFFYYCFDGTKEKAEEFVRRAIEEQKPDLARGKRQNILLAVELKETGQLVGHASIENVDRRPGREDIRPDKEDYEINFFTDPEFQNKGYGREAVANIMHYGFQKLKLEDYVITIHPENGPSQRVAQKEGYVKIGTTSLETTKGKQPRDVLVLTQDAFYKLRAQDSRPMIIGYGSAGGAAHKNTMG